MKKWLLSLKKKISENAQEKISAGLWLAFIYLAYNLFVYAYRGYSIGKDIDYTNQKIDTLTSMFHDFMEEDKIHDSLVQKDLLFIAQ